MKQCVVCGVPVQDRYDYCPECFESKIHELQAKYEAKEGPSTPIKENGEALASEPLTENTHH